MSFFKLDGFTYRILDASAGRSLTRRGKSERGARGALVDGRRRQRRRWSMRAAFLKSEHGYDDAQAFEHHVNGSGHYASFEYGLACSTGLNPLPGYTGVTWNSANGYDGTPGYLDTGATTLLQYDPQLVDKWTIIWREGGTAPLWLGGAAICSNGRASYNGTAFDWTDWTDLGADHTVEVIDGVVTFDGTTTSTLNDLIMLPWEATDAQLEFWTSNNLGASGRVWGPLPSLRASGTFIAEEFTHVVGEVTSVEYVQKPQRLVGNVSSIHINNAKIVTFDLSEVPSTYRRGDWL